MKNVIISSLMLVSSSVFAHNLPVNTTWKSDYVVGKGRVTLRVTTQERVSIDEDRNQCSFNQLGHLAACTQMATIPSEGNLFIKPIATDRITLVWALEGSNYELVHNLKDVSNGFIRLLKIDHEGRVVDSVRLFQNSN